MTISSAVTKIQYSGNGTTTAFAYPFKILDESEVEVVLVSSAGVETIQTITTNYTVSGVGADAGGTVTMLVAPTATQDLVLRRKPAFTQGIDYTPGDPFPAETHEEGLDRRTMETLYLKEIVERSLQLPIGSAAGVDPELPAPVALSVIRTNATATGFEFAAQSDIVAETESGFIVVEKSVSAGDQVIDISPQTYTPGINQIFVIWNGSFFAPSTENFTETNSTTITMASPFPGPGKLYVLIGVAKSGVVALANNVSYTPAGSGAVATDVQTKLRQYAVTPQDFGGTGDGVANDTVGVQAAFTANKGVVYFPPGTWRIGTINITNPVKVYMAKGAKIVPILGLGGGKMFNITSDDVHFEDVTVDATGETFTPATANTYIFYSGNGSQHYNHTFKNIKVIDASFSDGNSGVTNLLVTHPFYIDGVDNVTIENSYIKTASGAGVFAKNCEGLYVKNNIFWNTQWYTFNLAYAVKHFDFSDNIVICDLATGMYWGGAVNIVSDVGQTQVEHGKIHNNYFTGKYSYGSVIRIQSGIDITVEDNDLNGLSVGSLAASADLTGIRVTTRGTGASDKNEPCHGIRIVHNYLGGPDTTSVTGDARAIYVSNDHWTTNNPATGIHIKGNIIRSPSSSYAWSEPIQIHGLSGGIEHIWVEDNEVESLTKTGGIGAVAFIATGATGQINYVKIGGNSITDIGTPTASYQYGIGINAYVDNVVNTKPNTIENYYYGVRTLTNAGPTLERIDDQHWVSNTTDELFVVAPSLYARYLEGTATYDPPSLASGATTFTDVTVTGAALGQMVTVSFSLDNAGVIFTGYVRVANSVRVYLENKTGSPVDLGSGTLTVRVYR